MYAVMFSVYLLWLNLLSTLSCLYAQQCGRGCISGSECPSNMSCFPVPMLQGSRDLRSATCSDDGSICKSNTSCKPTRSFLYNETKQRCSDCCVPGLAYRTYSCSPPLQQINQGTLYYTNFTPQTGSLTKCTSQASFRSSDLVVSIATGWYYSIPSLCLQTVNIVAPNNRSVIAKVIDECISTSGCEESSLFLEPCAPNGVAATGAVWEQLGYEPGLLDIEWSRVNLTTTKAYSKVPESSGKRKLIAGIIIAAVFIAALGIIFVIHRNIRNRKEKALLSTELSCLSRQFTFQELQRATESFSLKLGEGGFGSVFRGKLGDGSWVAVKKVHTGLGSSKDKQFEAEIMSLGMISHVNLVQLRGYCIRPAHYMLVYEFMPNGSLDKWIFHSENNRFLSWNQRLAVALDVAQGLAYLHQGCSKQVLHLDIKPQNILLDDQLRGKISDFGLSNLAERGKSHVVTGLKGTPGYMAPEWLQTKVTDKTDVYSFGIVLLELVSSKRTVQKTFADGTIEHKTLGEIALDMFANGQQAELMDVNLFPEMEFQDAEMVIRIGLWCIQENPKLRPAMKDVVDMLQGAMDVLDPPTSSQRSSAWGFNLPYNSITSTLDRE